MSREIAVAILIITGLLTGLSFVDKAVMRSHISKGFVVPR